MGWKRNALDIGGVRAAEDYRHAGKDRVTIPHQKTKRWPHHTNDHIELFIAVLLQIIIAEHLFVVLALNCERFIDSVKNTMSVSCSAAETRTEGLVEDRKAWQRLVLIKEQEYLLVSGLSGARTPINRPTKMQNVAALRRTMMKSLACITARILARR